MITQVSDFHIIFERLSRMGAEMSLEEFEKSGCEVISVQFLGDIEGETSSTSTDRIYKWMFVLKERSTKMDN